MNSRVILLALVLVAGCKKVDDQPNTDTDMDNTAMAITDDMPDNKQVSNSTDSNTSDDNTPDAFERMDGGKYGNIYRDKQTGCQWLVIFEGDSPLPPVERKDANHQQVCGPMPKLKADAPSNDDTGANSSDDQDNTPPEPKKTKG